MPYLSFVQVDYHNMPKKIKGRTEMNGFTFLFSHHFTKGNNFCDFFLASLAEEALPKLWSTLKGKNLLIGRIFFF